LVVVEQVSVVVVREALEAVVLIRFFLALLPLAVAVAAVKGAFQGLQEALEAGRAVLMGQQ
jgi:hypothetical protein